MYALISQNFTGQQGNDPRIVPIKTDATYNQLTAAGFINPYMPSGFSFNRSDILAITYANDQSGFFKLSFANQTITIISDENDIVGDLTVDGNILATGNIIAGESGDAGYVASFPATASKGSLRMQGVANAGDTVTTISNAQMAQAAVISIPDPVASTANFILSAVPGGQSVAGVTASATPGTIRALKGLMTGSATTMSSGNLVGVRGEVGMVGASNGFIYGVQGKVIPTGTLSGSSWTAAVFGQFDVSAATINAGQLAAIWGDWGATGATATDLTGCRGIAFTNTTANVLNAQDYRYGNATYLMELAGDGGTLNYFANAGTGAGSWGNATPPTPSKVLRLSINSTSYYLPLVAQNT